MCDLHINVKSVQLVQSHGAVMTCDFPRINANVLKSIRPWQLHDIRRNLRVRAHQCTSTVLSTKDSVSRGASSHPWQNLDYDSITPRVGQVNADDYITAKLIFPPSPESETECICEATINRSEHHSPQRRVDMLLNINGFHERTQWVKPIPLRSRLEAIAFQCCWRGHSESGSV